MRWEYKRLEFGIAEVASQVFQDELDAAGREGWELVATIQHARHGYSQQVHLVFKRSAVAKGIEPGPLRVARSASRAR
ncbi:hypothetical protein AKJ09_11204 [Labilithrix luteola]|uniref:DUF4177 domain-containing protein n=2 Tax=Labilithrix luteola TaxID=1391654 RepID=A0A0K1QFI7_9BACT|nr:hypothetical protein AKJ09_11204 [Labilithrix luteola]